MVLIKHYIKKDSVELELKLGYETNLLVFKTNHAILLSMGFKLNKVRRTYNKTFYTKDYTNERFNKDLNKVKEMFQDYKIESYKLVNEEKSYK